MPLKTSFTGDASDLQRSTRAVRDEFRQVGAEAGKTSRELKAAGSAFDGTRLEGAALKAVRGVERVGGASRLTARELQQVSRIIQEATEKGQRLGVAVAPQIQRLARELQTVQREAQRTSTSLSEMLASGRGATASRGLLGGGLVAGVGAGIGLGALVAASSALKDIAATGTQLGPIRQGFDAMQGGGERASQTLQRMRVATRGLVDDLSLMQAANRGVLLGLTDMGIDMAEVARVATVLGRAVGQDAAKSTDDLTVALARQSPMILDNLGIKLNLSEANAQYAASLGKTVDALTDEEKKLAFATAAMAAARAKAAELGEAELTVAEEASRVGVAVSGMATDLVSAANQSSVLATALGGVADALSAIREQNRQTINDTAEGLSRWSQLWSQVRAGSLTGFAFSLAGAPGTPNATSQQPPGAVPPLPQVAPPASYVAQLNEARVALSKLTAEQVKQIRAAKELGKSNKEAAEAAGTSEAVVRLWEAQAKGAKMAATETKRLADEAVRLEQVWQRMLRPQIGLGPDVFSRTGIAGALQPSLSTSAANLLAAASNIPSTNPLSAVLGYQYTRMSSDVPKLTSATREWRTELHGVAQAFAQLAQAAGPALDSVSRGVGVTLTSANAAEELARALRMVDERGQLTRGGQVAAGGFAGLTTGLALGGLTSNLVGGGILGAGGGAAAGYLAAGTGAATGVGLAVGALAGVYAAYRNRQAQRAQMEQLRQDAIAAAGGLEQLQQQAVRAGFSVEEFMRRFQSSDPREFTSVLNDMNIALAAQERQARELAEALTSVTEQQGILSAQQLAQIRNAAGDGPAAEAIVAFAQQQRQSTLAGILRAAAALQQAMSLTDDELEALTEGITDSEERQARIEAALRDRATSVMNDLRTGVQATASAIFVAIQDALASGERLVDVLAILAPAITTVRDLFERSGQTPGAGFQQVESYQRIASGAQTGPALELAIGLGQALAGFANTGLLSPELFAELANGIGAAYKQMENLGQGGIDAARLMQPALQNIWQMVQDYPGLRDQLDADTLALLEFAEESGLVGDQFRPAVDRMIRALDDLIAKLDEFLARMAEAQGLTLPTPPSGQPGAPSPGGGGGGGGDTSGGGGGEYPNPGGLADGGIVTRPTLSWVGEGGEPEAVIPLSRWHDMAGPQRQDIYVQVGREVLTRAVVRGLPREVRMVAQ